jgi:DNA-binding IscR family transcriptional regulator
MSNISKAITLAQAVELLEQADALVQSALGNTEQCFELHCAIATVADELEEAVEQLEEMQITD